ncbi:MAG: glycosyltransferase family 2 protein [candidate division WOR-3 bacterium]|nr:glycosyltransferase family 2 protein [candidate division WOR-3 bacterium]
MKKKTKVTVVIVNWNGGEETIACVNSLQKCTYSDFDLVIVDNGSRAKDVKLLEERFGHIARIIKNNVNLGFAGGVNKGIEVAIKNCSKYILLLNNDTIVSPDFLEILVNHAEKEPEIGIVTPKINYYSSPGIIWSAGGFISKLRASGFSYGEGRNDSEYASNRIISFASGCCMLIKAEVISQVGFFDENYFLYVEDADFCYRVTSSGYKILYAASSKIFHKVNRTSKKDVSNLPLYYTTRNRLYFAKKFLSEMFLISLFYLILSLFPKSFIWAIRGEFNNLVAVRLAFRDFLKRKFGKANYFKN